MHSPPVQPISSITSGTGSVSTMWEEVTVSRVRSSRRARAAAPIATTAAPARTRPPAVSASTPDDEPCAPPPFVARSDPPPTGGAPRASRLTRELSNTSAPSPHLGAGQVDHPVRRPQRSRGRHGLTAHVVEGGRRRHAHVARLVEPGFHALGGAPVADEADGVARGVQQRPGRTVAETLAQSRP